MRASISTNQALSSHSLDLVDDCLGGFSHRLNLCLDFLQHLGCGRTRARHFSVADRRRDLAAAIHAAIGSRKLDASHGGVARLCHSSQVSFALRPRETCTCDTLHFILEALEIPAEVE